MTDSFIQELISSPELYTEGIKVLRQDILIRLIPVLITFIIAFDGISYIRQKNSKTASRFVKVTATLSVLLISFLLHVGVYYLTHFYLLESWDVDNTVSIIAKMWYSYQDYEYVGASLFISTIFALVFGVVIRRIIAQEKISALARVGATLLTCTCLTITITLMYKGFAGINHLVINEVCSNNFSTAIDDIHNVSDYVEIYNIGGHACSTGGLYLSDDEDNLKKLKIDEFLIPNFSYAVLPIDDSFGISKEGDTVYLSDETGYIVDYIEIPALGEDVSFSRVTNGAEKWAITGCTPGSDNCLSVNKIASPEFSKAAGFYDNEFNLELSADDNVSIYYTLDGSVPSMDSYLYVKPIHVYDRSREANVYRSVRNVIDPLHVEGYSYDDTPVDKAFIVRAIAIYNDRFQSDIVTQTYFVGLDKYKDHATVSLVGPPGQFFGENGIYVTGPEYDEWLAEGCPELAYEDKVYPNFTKHDMGHEAEVSMEYFSPAGFFEQNVGIRIQGDLTSTFPLKNFSVIARKDYSGSSHLPNELLGTNNTHNAVLRGGFANSVYQDLAQGLDVAVQRYENVTVFLDGEFWYNGSIVEKYNKQYFKEHYDIDSDNLMLFKDGVLQEGIPGEEEVYNEFVEYCNSLDFTDDAVYEEFCKKVDIQSYIDLMCIYVYIGNTDRNDFTHNNIMWKTREVADDENSDTSYSDGRWRWALYDLDQADVRSKDQEANSNNVQTILGGDLFSQLSKNPQFRKRFLETLEDISTNVFSEENVRRAIDRFEFETDDCKTQQYGQDVKSKEDHYNYLVNRKKYVVEYCREYFRNRLV